MKGESFCKLTGLEYNNSWRKEIKKNNKISFEKWRVLHGKNYCHRAL
jgi:hypothetical protein